MTNYEDYAINSASLSLDGEVWCNLGTYERDGEIVVILAQVHVPRFSGELDAKLEEMTVSEILETYDEVMFHPIDYEKTVVYNKE